MTWWVQKLKGNICNTNNAHRNAEYSLWSQTVILKHIQVLPFTLSTKRVVAGLGWMIHDVQDSRSYHPGQSLVEFGLPWFIHVYHKSLLRIPRPFWGSDSLTSKTTIWGGLPNRREFGRAKKNCTDTCLVLGGFRWLKKVKLLILESLSAVEIQMQHATINKLQGILAHELQFLPNMYRAHGKFL